MQRAKVSTILFLSAAMTVFSAPARAEYKCDAPPSALDQRACEKAKEGPRALRQFIESRRSIESLYFFDYMTDAQLVAWRNAPQQATADEARVETE